MLMETIRFNTVVDQDQVIRPPAGVALPKGKIEVTVRSLSQPPAPKPIPWHPRGTGLAGDAERADPELPRDMAEHHDHYAHGKPLP
jgi:hypothetical protein